MSCYAAIDIGSNSIRMMAAEMDGEKRGRVLAEDRQVVRLGTGVFRDGKLSAASIDLACQVLARMAANYGKYEVLGVRAVGTSALRDASNQSEFLQRAGEVLGQPVEVISGLEEARLVQLGVEYCWPHPGKRVVVVDIGGGSAQMALAEDDHFTKAFSKPLGAVRLTEMFLKSDPPDEKEVARLRRYVQERIAEPVKLLRDGRIDRLIGTSSTAAAAVCAANLVKRARREDADRMSASAKQVRELFRKLCGLDVAGRARVAGIGPRRAEIVVAGVAVLNEIMLELKAGRIYYSTAGVRDGIIADLSLRRVGMEKARLDADQRQVVRALARQYGVSTKHVKKVAEIAAALYEQLRPLHRLPTNRGRVLEAAAYLYNIGHFVNEAKHHRHSMYLVANSDLPGFDDREHAMIANLCRYHRKSMPQPAHEQFQQLLPEDRRAVELLAPLLRLAVALDQSQNQVVEKVETRISNAGVEVRLFSDQDADIEQWHAGQVAMVFQQAYGAALAVRARRA